MNLDCLIIYEHRTRELENACLLAEELERRGYKTSIQNTYCLKKYFLNPRVIVTPHLYNDNQVISLAKNIKGGCNSIVDLQYEQVLSENTKNDIHTPKGEAVFAQHVAWGNAQEKAYLDGGIPSKNIHITGHMAMDFLKPEFKNYYFSKEEIAKRFKLNPAKKWVLFLSSFSYVNRSESEMEKLSLMSSTAREFQSVSEESFRSVMDWLKCAAEYYPEYIFIYRKHPAEKDNPYLHKVESAIPNFRCINAYSVRQWILLADKIYTWFSTSIVDAFFAGRECYILRPNPIPRKLDGALFIGASIITRQDDFNRSIQEKQHEFPISSESIEYYYGNNAEGFAFSRVADVCEKMINGIIESHNYSFGTSRIDMHNNKRVSIILKDYLYALVFELSKIINLSKVLSPIPFIKKEKKQILAMYATEGFRVEKEIKLYRNKIRQMLASISKESK